MKTVQDFISSITLLHGSKYDYSKVQYINKSTKVCIICKEHGEFWQTPSNHLQGKGCMKCGRDKTKTTIKNKLFLDRVESIEQPDEYKLIKLNNGEYVMVDNEDFDKVKHYPWCIKDGYAYNRVLGRMHRYIMNAPDNMLVDHKEVGNTLDNLEVT